MRSLFARRPIETFFLLALLLSWAAVLPVVLNPALAPEPFQILGGLLGPTGSALVVLGVTEGRTALAAFLRRYVQWQAGVPW